MCIDDTNSDILKAKHSMHQHIIALEEMVLNISFKTFMRYTQNMFSASTDDIHCLFAFASFIFASFSCMYKWHCFSQEQLQRLQ